MSNVDAWIEHNRIISNFIGQFKEELLLNILRDYLSSEVKNMGKILNKNNFSLDSDCPNLNTFYNYFASRLSEICIQEIYDEDVSCSLACLTEFDFNEEGNDGI